MRLVRYRRATSFSNKSDGNNEKPHCSGLPMLTQIPDSLNFLTSFARFTSQLRTNTKIWHQPPSPTLSIPSEFLPRTSQHKLMTCES